jgi:phosphoglycerol transferase MdoB-like AlkP superfamily enzyme
MKKIKAFFQKQKPKSKEWFRKRLVTLKRRPFFIPLTMLIISCFVLNLSLTAYSDTVAQINEPGMGLTLFVIALCSYLTIVGFATAFPNRKKPKIASVVLVCLMLLISIGCQILFHYFIRYGTELKPNPIVITPSKAFILKAKKNSVAHAVCNFLSLLLIVTMPVYGKWLGKIDTSIKAVDEIHIEKLELAEEEKY